MGKIKHLMLFYGVWHLVQTWQDPGIALFLHVLALAIRIRAPQVSDSLVTLCAVMLRPGKLVDMLQSGG